MYIANEVVLYCCFNLCYISVTHNGMANIKIMYQYNFTFNDVLLVCILNGLFVLLLRYQHDTVCHRWVQIWESCMRLICQYSVTAGIDQVML
jgi:hypothetical protein